MEKEALQYLAQLLATEKPDGDFPAVLAPKDMAVLSLEVLQKNPNMMRGTFRTTLIGAFVSYIGNGLAGADKFVFIDGDAMAAHAVLDHGEVEPGWCAYNAFLKLRPTAEYHALIVNNTSQLTPNDLVDFFIDFEDRMTFFDADDSELSTSVVFASMRNLNILKNEDVQIEDGDFTQATTELERISLDSLNSSKLPAYFHFTTRPYEELSEQIFRCRMRSKINDKKALFFYRIENQETLHRLIIDEFRTMLVAQLDDAPIYHGQFEHHYPQVPAATLHTQDFKAETEHTVKVR